MVVAIMLRLLDVVTIVVTPCGNNKGLLVVILVTELALWLLEGALM